MPSDWNEYWYNQEEDPQMKYRRDRDITFRIIVAIVFFLAVFGAQLTKR